MGKRTFLIMIIMVMRIMTGAYVNAAGLLKALKVLGAAAVVCIIICMVGLVFQAMHDLKKSSRY